MDIDSLTAFKTYKFLLSDCSNAKTLYNEFNIQTEHDSKYPKFNVKLHFANDNLIDEFDRFIVCSVPSPVTNHKIFKKNGIVVEWSAPIDLNGILEYYLIEWTVSNMTHSERIDYHDNTDRNVFKVSFSLSNILS